MRQATHHAALAQLRSWLWGLLLDSTGPFGSVLTVPQVQERIAQHAGDRDDRVFTPLVTLCTFLDQLRDDDPSCRAAVARLNAFRVRQGLPPCSPQTGGYCKARQRLPEALLKDLRRDTGRRLHEQAPEAWLWHGRAVKIVDGSGVSMPDTPANQEAYPQPSGQAPGVGFPVARLVVLLSLACGVILDAAVGPSKGKQTGETQLFHTLHDQVDAGDVVLADRYFCSYWEIALLQGRGADVVMRLHPRRHVDFRCGLRLGREDHLVSWSKPARPAWMDAATYAALPTELAIRELRVCVLQRGFRTRLVVVATTLRDETEFCKEEIAGLYRARWHAELDLRAIKITMRMDVLRCQTPTMVRKEIWGHLLVYNLLRAAMAQAAFRHGLPPRQLSLQGARQTLAAFRTPLGDGRGSHRDTVVAVVLKAIASHRVGNRPDRSEPRVRKRRPKKYPLMTQSRSKLQGRLARAG